MSPLPSCDWLHAYLPQIHEISEGMRPGGAKKGNATTATPSRTFGSYTGSPSSSHEGISPFFSISTSSQSMTLPPQRGRALGQRRATDARRGSGANVHETVWTACAHILALGGILPSGLPCTPKPSSGGIDRERFPPTRTAQGKTDERPQLKPCVRAMRGRM